MRDMRVCLLIRWRPGCLAWGWLLRPWRRGRTYLPTYTIVLRGRIATAIAPIVVRVPSCTLRNDGVQLLLWVRVRLRSLWWGEARHRGWVGKRTRIPLPNRNGNRNVILPLGYNGHDHGCLSLLLPSCGHGHASIRCGHFHGLGQGVGVVTV
jgi:hypothetical protein